MCRGQWWLVLVLLGVGGSGIGMGAEPDPEAVRRLMEKYEREAAEEAARKASVPKPRPKPEPASKSSPKPKPAPMVNYDHEAWKSAERCGTAACFRVYLKKHPQGQYAEMARAWLESESKSQVPAAAPVLGEKPAQIPVTREGNQAVAALLDSADKYVNSGQLDKASEALMRALQIEPRNAGIWHDLAQIRLHQGQYQQAESLASKSSNLAGGNRVLQSRNWKVIAAARKASGNSAGAEEAQSEAEAWAGSHDPEWEQVQTLQRPQ